MMGAIDAADEFLGLTATECALDCRDGHCAITHRDHCGHPNKGGIQSIDQMSPPTLRRFSVVKRRLAVEAAAEAARKEAP